MADQYLEYGLSQDSEIKPKVPAPYIFNIVPDYRTKVDSTSPVHLGKSCDPGQHCKSLSVPILVLFNFPGHVGSGPYQTHVPCENVQQLWQFVQAGLAQDAANTSHL